MDFNYPLYSHLQDGRKKILIGKFQLIDKPSNANWLNAKEGLFHEDGNTLIDIYFEKHKARPEKYKIGLLNSDFQPKPFFRYDSDGPAHRNICPDLKIIEQILTPHFNFYDKHGCGLAMKTTLLESEHFLNDILFNPLPALQHFCDIANIETDGITIRITEKEPQIPFTPGKDFLEFITFE